MIWQNKNLWIVSREGLIRMKELAGRAKDLIDIDRIKMKKVDMSSKAITRRLKQTDQLRELSLSLMKAKKISDEKAENNKPKVKTVK